MSTRHTKNKLTMVLIILAAPSVEAAPSHRQYQDNHQEEEQWRYRYSQSSEEQDEQQEH